jgi:uncharacterized NAD(P)/FAD-binding protein YdhS
MKSDGRGPAADVIIVGGGYSGTMLAAQLARRGTGAVIIEGGGRAGRGAAYSTDEPAHLLNVTAGRMSAWADRQDDFAKAVAGEGYAPGDFVPRMRFGAYLRDILDQSKAEVVDGWAVGAERDGDGWTVRLSDGRTVAGTARDLPEQLFVNDPWSDGGRAALRRVAASGGEVLIIGTGLTMVDVVLSLDEAGHRGGISAVSRRGLVPRGHGEAEGPPPQAIGVPDGDLMELWRWVRRRSGQVGWRAAVGSLRDCTQGLWARLPIEQQSRFLRHARPWWDVHRHRIAPAVAARLKRLIGEGRLSIRAGRVRSMAVAGEGLEVVIAPRGGERERTLKVALAINCTGPSHGLARTRDPLLADLRDQGAIRADPLGLAIDVAADSRAVGAERLWVVGPLSKAAFWEIVAVPDIRHQVAAVAEAISQELHEDGRQD